MTLTFIISTFLGLVPSFVWIWFFLREDEAHPEPKRLIFYVFLSGAAMTFFVFGPQILLNNILTSLGIEPYSALSLFLLGGLEEVGKFLAVYFTVRKRKEFDEPIDAMIYMIISALGFAAIENIASAFQGLPQVVGETDILEITALRFIGATLLHSLSSAFIGYYWGLAMARGKDYFKLIAEGIGIATLLHAVFNSLIIVYGPETLLATLFLVSTAFFVLNDFEKLKTDNI